MRKNTTYRKGVIKQEVGKEASRKYLSAAKKLKKQLDSDPSNKELQKKYNRLMSKHDVERAKARRAAEVGAKRSQRKASLKRTMTMTAVTVATSTACIAGARIVNRYLNKHDTTLNGRRVNISAKNLRDCVDFIKKAKDLMGYFY